MKEIQPGGPIAGGVGRVFMERVDYGRRVTFRLGVWSHADVALGKFHEMQPATFAGREEGEVPGPPAITMDERLAQAMADELWRIGFRPTQGRQSEGEAGARMRHLEDMRAIAFAKLDVQRPESRQA